MRLKRRSWVLAAQHHAEATSASMVMCTEYGEGMLAKHSALVAMQHEAWMPLCGGAGAVMGCVSACPGAGLHADALCAPQVVAAPGPACARCLLPPPIQYAMAYLPHNNLAHQNFCTVT